MPGADWGAGWEAGPPESPRRQLALGAPAPAQSPRSPGAPDAPPLCGATSRSQIRRPLCLQRACCLGPRLARAPGQTSGLPPGGLVLRPRLPRLLAESLAPLLGIEKLHLWDSWGHQPDPRVRGQWGSCQFSKGFCRDGGIDPLRALGTQGQRERSYSGADGGGTCVSLGCGGRF